MYEITAPGKPQSGVWRFELTTRDGKAVIGQAPCVAIEATHPDFWHKYVGTNGAVVGINRFGESAPADKLFELFGFTVANVVNTAKGLLS